MYKGSQQPHLRITLACYIAYMLWSCTMMMVALTMPLWLAAIIDVTSTAVIVLGAAIVLRVRRRKNISTDT